MGAVFTSGGTSASKAFSSAAFALAFASISASTAACVRARVTRVFSFASAVFTAVAAGVGAVAVCCAGAAVGVGFGAGAFEPVVLSPDFGVVRSFFATTDLSGWSSSSLSTSAFAWGAAFMLPLVFDSGLVFFSMAAAVVRVPEPVPVFGVGFSSLAFRLLEDGGGVGLEPGNSKLSGL